MSHGAPLGLSFFFRKMRQPRVLPPLGLLGTRQTEILRRRAQSTQSACIWLVMVSLSPTGRDQPEDERERRETSVHRRLAL